MPNKDKVKEAKYILTMLEADNINHYEINARVWCLVANLNYDKTIKAHGIHYCTKKNTLYTTSLDACQSIMLEGWNYSVSHARLFYKGDFFGLGTVSSPNVKKTSPDKTDTALSTAPLAWLHAIIQSYIWEWEND